MAISKQELADGIRFAGERAAAAATYCKDWDYQLGHQWTSRDAFAHVAATAGGLARVYPLLDAGVLGGYNQEAAAAGNAQAIAGMAEKSQEEIVQGIRDGCAASASFVEGLAQDDLDTVVTLGGYEMPKGEIVAQVWIHHSIAHAYEASARWPLQ